MSLRGTELLSEHVYDKRISVEQANGCQAAKEPKTRRRLKDQTLNVRISLTLL